MYILASGRGWWIFMSHPVYRERANWLRRSLSVPPTHTIAERWDKETAASNRCLMSDQAPSIVEPEKKDDVSPVSYGEVCSVSRAQSSMHCHYTDVSLPWRPLPLRLRLRWWRGTDWSQSLWHRERFRLGYGICCVIPHTFLSLAFNTNLICLTIKHVMIRSVWYWFQFVLVYVPLTGQAVLWFRWLHAS